MFCGNLLIDRNITRITPTPNILKYISKIFSMETPEISTLFTYDQNFSSTFLKSKPVNQYLIGSAIIFDFQGSLLQSSENPTISEILRKLISLGYFVPQIYKNQNFMKELMKNFKTIKDFLSQNLKYEYLKECSFAIGFLLSSISSYYSSLDFGESNEQFLSEVLEIYLYPNLLDETSIPLFFDFFIASFQNFSIDKEFNEKEFSIFLSLMQIIISTLTMDITYNFDYLFLAAKLLLFITSEKLPIPTRIEIFQCIISITSKYEEISIRLTDKEYSNSIVNFIYDYINDIPFNISLTKAKAPIKMPSILSTEIMTPINSTISDPFFKEEPYKPLTMNEIMVSASLKLPNGFKELEDNKEIVVLITTISNLCHSIRFKEYYLNQIDYMRTFINNPKFNESPIAPFFLTIWALRVLSSKDKATLLSEYFHQIEFFSKMLFISYDKYNNEYLRKFTTDVIVYLSYMCQSSDFIVSDLLKFFLKKALMVQLDDMLTNCIAVLASINDEVFINVCQEQEINFAQNVASCMLMYQKICNKIKEGERLERIQKNRRLLLNCIEKISFANNNNVFTYLCSKESYFIVIMSHFYDVSTADFAFAQIKSAISLFNANYPCIRYIFKFFATKFFNAYDSKNFPVQILEKIIDFCIEGFIVHPLPIGQIFSESNFLETLVKFSIEIEATDCIEKLLDLLNHISTSQCDYTPNIAIFLKLSPLIKSRKNMSLADFLLKIAFGDDNKMNFTRKIINPGPLSLLLQVYKDDEKKLSEYLTFIQKCFVFSMFEIVHTNLPSQLILYLAEYRHKPRNQLFDQALNFLSEIMTYSISTQDLLSYFQLLTIITPEKIRPFYTIDLLETLINVFKNQKNSALTFFGLSEQTKGIQIPIITTDVLNNNFSIIIRIFIIQKDGTIFHLSNDNEFLTLAFGADSLLVLNGQQLDMTLPISQWITFTFSYSKSGFYQIIVNDQVLDTINNKFNFKEDFYENIIALQLKCNIESIIIEKNKVPIYNFNAYSFYQKYAVDQNQVAEVNGSVFHLQQPPKVVLNVIGGASVIIPLFAQLELHSADEKDDDDSVKNNGEEEKTEKGQIDENKEDKDNKNKDVDSLNNENNNDNTNAEPNIIEGKETNENREANETTENNENNETTENNENNEIIENKEANETTENNENNETTENKEANETTENKETNEIIENKETNEIIENKETSDKSIENSEFIKEFYINDEDNDENNNYASINIDDEDKTNTSSGDFDKLNKINKANINKPNKKSLLLKTILTLISESLRNSPQLQSDFCSEEGFRMIGELLSIISVDAFSNDVIQQLFNIFNTITDRNLRKQMIEYIFFNMTTWLYVVDQYENYFTSLFNLMCDLVMRDSFYKPLINVTNALLIMRCYLYSKYDESFCLLKDPKVTFDGKTIAERPTFVHLKIIRCLFLKFILNLSNHVFTEEDLLMIVYFCFDSSDILFQSLIITLLSRMIKKGHKFLFKFLSQGLGDKFYELLDGLKSTNITLSNSVMALFSSLVWSNTLKFTDVQIKYKILTTVRTENFNAKYFHKLFISTSDFSFKVPLLLYSLSAISDLDIVLKDFNLLINKKEAIEDFEKNEHFYYMFLMHCFLDSRYEKIIEQLISGVSLLCFKKLDPFTKILKFTEFIEFQLMLDLSPFLRKFFIISLDKLNGDFIRNLNQSQFFYIVSTLYFFIFRIPSFDTYSNFALENRDIKLPVLSFIQIFKLMNKSPTVTINYSFGLRTTIENEWLDWEIAIKGIDTIFSQSIDPFIEEFSMFVGAGLQHKKHSNAFISRSHRLLELFRKLDFNQQMTKDSFVIYMGCISRYYYQNVGGQIQKKLEDLLNLVFQTFQNQICSLLRIKPQKNSSESSITNTNFIIYESLPLFVERLQKIEKTISKKLSEDVKIDMTNFVADDSMFNNLPKIQIPKERIKEKISLFSTFLKKSSRQSMKKYKQLFQSLSSDNGPWMSPENPPVIHYKLDINSTKRTRLIPNLKFKNHREASLARDLGSFKDAKAIMQERLAKMKLESFAGDFSLIEFDDKDDQLELNKKKAIANIDIDKVIIKCQSHLITPKKVHKGYLNLTKEAIIFDSDSKFINLNLNKVKKILLRRYLMDDTAVEIFCTFSKVYFVNFQNESERLQFLNKITSLKVPSIKYIQRKGEEVKKMALKATEKWQNGELSNFQYLMKLNVIAGRSFNDLSQYPVFPWVIKDYKSDTIDLYNPSIYRDLSVPIAAHGEQRLKWMREKMEQSVTEDTRYLFGAFYSSSAVVIGYLIRMEPFTSLHIQLQSGRFDITDRLFVSIPSSWDSVTSAQMDFRELIPEFYLIPDFLSNVNNFDLGKNVNGEVIGDVKLPPWSKNPREFIEINKRALESPFVTENLHKWIDIIFGPHSRMPLADEANNVFHPYFYEDSLDKAKLRSNDESDMTIKLIKEYAACFGICPLQIFDKIPEARKVPSIQRPIAVNDETSRTIIFNDSSPLISLSYDHDTVIVVSQDLHFNLMRLDDTAFLSVFSKGRFAVKIPGELIDIVPIVAASKKFAILAVPWSTNFSIFMLEKHGGGNVLSFSDVSISTQPISALAASSNYIAVASNDCTLRTWIVEGSDDSNVGGIVGPSLLTPSQSQSLAISENQNDESILLSSSKSPIVRTLSFSSSFNNFQSIGSNNNANLSPSSSFMASSKVNFTLRPIGFLAKHGQPIVFIEISEHLNLVFSISRDGFVSCISLAGGRYLHGVELGMSEPSLFAVSRTGYVCVAFNGPDSSVVIILDQNLEKIGTAHFDSTIIRWTPCEKTGIDFMAIIFKNQTLSILALPKLDLTLVHRSLKTKVQSMTFSRKPAKIFLGTDNGKIVVLDLI